MEFEIGNGQHHSGVGAPPQNGLTLAIPRKNTLLIGLNQALCRYVLAGNGSLELMNGMRAEELGIKAACIEWVS